jgi:hypothetical protein
VLLAAATLIAVLAAAAGCVVTRRPGAAWLLLLFCAAWLPVNRPIEGPVILRLSPGHGITLADLLSIAGFGVAAVVLWRAHPRVGSGTSSGRRAASMLVAVGIALAGAAAAYQH